MKEAVLALSVVSLLASGALDPASAQPSQEPLQPQTQNEIVVGLFDENGSGQNINIPGVSVTYKSFHPEGTIESKGLTEGGISHGDSVALSAIDEIRKINPTAPIRIVSAGIFYRTADKPNMRTFSGEGALKALEWFKQENVKVISMAFVSQDKEELRTVVNKAQSDGFVLVAGTPNISGGKNVWPAAYEGVISVTGIAPELPVRQGDMAWGKIAIQGDVTFSVDGKKSRDFGSSMATGRIAGVLSYYSSLKQNISYETSMRFLAKASKMENLSQGYWRKERKAEMNVYDRRKFEQAVQSNLASL